MEARPDITPDLKVGALLKHYPELEDTLVGLSPEFRRLKNPVLRRTVGAVASLRQVSVVGGVPLGALVGTLRQAAGLAAGDPDALADGGDAKAPGWFHAPDRTFDARPVIDGGGHPLDRVLKDLAGLAPGQVYELVTPFVPAPLIDVARGRGFDSWTAPQADGGEVRTYFAGKA